MSPPVLCGVAVTCKSQSRVNLRAVSCCHLCWHMGCLTGEVLAGHQGTRAGLSAEVMEGRHRTGAAGPRVQDKRAPVLVLSREPHACGVCKVLGNMKLFHGGPLYWFKILRRF